MFSSKSVQKTNSLKAQRTGQVTLSVKNYNNDKQAFGVPIKRNEVNRSNTDTTRLKIQPIEINMGFQPYKPRSRRSSITSDDAISDIAFSDYSSDNESVVRLP